MLKKYLYFICITILGSSTVFGQTGDIPASRLYPKIKVEATSLVIVDLAHDKIDGQVAACGLQGIINRDSKQKVYVLNTYCHDNHGGWKNPPDKNRQVQMGSIWLKQVFATMPKQELKTDTSQYDPGFMALISHYKKAVKGIIIYDDSLRDATTEAATTIAGQTDGLILSPELAEKVKAYHFPVIADLRGKFKNDVECLRWLKDNYFAGANHQIAFTWSHMDGSANSWGGANKDYVVANRLFTFYLNIEDKQEAKHYEDIVKLYPPGTPIMGWTNELVSDHLFAEYGYFMVPCIAVENLSVMSSFPSQTAVKQVPKAYPVSDNAVYVAFLVSDGDNLLHTMIYEPYTMLNSPDFGTIPTTWIINPGIADLAPPVFNWWQSRNKNQEIGAMMGDGSPQSDRFAGHTYYCGFAKHYLQQTGILTMKQMVEGEEVSWRVQPYVVNSGYAGTDARGIGPYEYHMNGRSFVIGTTNMDETRLFKTIDDAPAGQPLFLSVFCGGAHRDLPAMIKALSEKMQARNDGKKYYFVRTMDLAATYRSWKGMPIE